MPIFSEKVRRSIYFAYWQFREVREVREVREKTMAIANWRFIMSRCVCCSNQLLRHIRYGRVYWFCSHCRQEMPELTEVIAARQSQGSAFKRLIEHPA